MMDKKGALALKGSAGGPAPKMRRLPGIAGWLVVSSKVEFNALHDTL